MKKIKSKVFRLTLFLGLACGFLNVQAVEIIPRVGVAAGILWTEDNIAAVKDWDVGISPTYGVNGGVVFAMKDNYIDLSFDTLNYDIGLSQPVDKNMPNKGWRSEYNFTYGHRMFAGLYGFVGYRHVGWSPSLFGNSGSTEKGIFLGISLSNMEWGDELLSIALGEFFGKFETPEGSSDAEGFLMRVSWREKGSNSLWSVKWSQVGPQIQDGPLTIGYSYLFY